MPRYQGEISENQAILVNYSVRYPLQSQNAVPAYFTSKQLLPFGFAEQSNYITGVSDVITKCDK